MFRAQLRDLAQLLTIFLVDKLKKNSQNINQLLNTNSEVNKLTKIEKSKQDQPKAADNIDAPELGERLRKRRLAKGWSLDELAAEMGGLVTKQSLHKYEKAHAHPSPRVLIKIAQALEVPVASLAFTPETTVSFVAYRRGCRVNKTQQKQIEARVEFTAEQRVRLQKIVGQKLELPELTPIKSVEDAERAADELREEWNLGVDAICSLSTVLEDHGIHIIEVDAPDGFDGLSANFHDTGGERVAAAVITKDNLCGDRWRLTTAHELAHLALKFAPEFDQTDNKLVEGAAYRFAGAFLAPRKLIDREVGTDRHSFSLAELWLLKPRFGLSVQAILRRFCDLGIITPEDFKQWFIFFNVTGLRKKEKYELPKEEPTWLKQNTYRALSEGLITRKEAQTLLGDNFDESDFAPQATSLRERRAFLRLPMDDRRRILEADAKRAEAIYAENNDWREWEAVHDDFEQE
jgi:transcriptional regulator with XRE-family HTH domain